MIRRKYNDLDPNEIFMDSSNLPNFDRSQFEGRMEKSVSSRVYFAVFAVFLLAVATISARAWFLQVKNHSQYALLSATNRLRFSEIFSERGVIYDRSGKVLAENYADEAQGDFLKRKYADYDGLGHILGFVKYPQKDSAGFYYATKVAGVGGAEKIFDGYLSGLNGLNIVEIDALGQMVSKNAVQKAEKGRDIHLTVDAGLNEALFGAIKGTAQEIGFTGGAGAIMDIETGEVLALASYPEFNPQILTDGTDRKTIAGYGEDESLPYLNRVVSGLYTPGSTVKLFLSAAALNEKIIDPRKEIISTGYLEIPNPYDPKKSTRFNDWKAHGAVDMRRALAVSSNVYFFEIGGGYKSQPGLGIDKIEKYARAFGYGLPVSGSPFFAGPSGTIPSPSWKLSVFKEEWRLGDTYNTSIGQYGFEATPMQALVAVSAVANGGKIVQPIIAKEELGLYPPKETGIDPAHFSVVREGMRQAVTEGTAKGIYFSDLSIGAKTGTAEIGTRKLFVNSWIVGFFPYEKPKYAFVTVMERGPRENTIGALYVMRQVMSWIKENRPEYLAK